MKIIQAVPALLVSAYGRGLHKHGDGAGGCGWALKFMGHKSIPSPAAAVTVTLRPKSSTGYTGNTMGSFITLRVFNRSLTVQRDYQWQRDGISKYRPTSERRMGCRVSCWAGFSLWVEPTVPGGFRVDLQVSR